MAIKVLKYIAKAVYLETDEKGDNLREHLSEEFSLYTKAQVEQWLQMVDEFAAQQNASIQPPSDKPEAPLDAGKTQS